MAFDGLVSKVTCSHVVCHVTKPLYGSGEVDMLMHSRGLTFPAKLKNCKVNECLVHGL